MKTEELYKLFLKHPSVSTDSRKTSPGSIFFALRGERFDGNQFAAQAIGAGAVKAVIDDPAAGEGPEYIPVEDALLTLQELAAYHRSRLGIPVMAVTGSNGKTTTKDLIAACLSAGLRTASTRGNLNNHIGVPLSLLELNDRHEIGIIEMGASHRGEIARLCEIASPDYGLITNIGKAHLEGFGSQEGVRMAKGELYTYLGSRQKTIFVNGGDELLVEMAAVGNAQLVCYGDADQACVRGRVLGADPLLSLELTYRSGGVTDKLVVNTRVFGTYNLDNYLAAACVAEHFSIDRKAVKKALEGYTPDNMRSQLVEKGTNLVVLDSYNANPDSMKAAIDDFARLDHPQKVLILGDMLELGDRSPEEHAGLLQHIGRHRFSAVYLTGSNFTRAGVPDEYLAFTTTGELAAHLQAHPLRDATILVKGSRLLALEEVLSSL